jgi:hypothetical protein
MQCMGSITDVLVLVPKIFLINGDMSMNCFQTATIHASHRPLNFNIPSKLVFSNLYSISSNKEWGSLELNSL